MSEFLVDEVGELLKRVRKPSSYLGLEPNSVHKDLSTVKGTIALVYPDLYDIGMSHLGLKLLYSFVNSCEELWAERCFAPGQDMANELKRNKLPLTSLESKKPLSKFDVIGFTIPYELSYTTILWMLSLAGIPLRSSDRDESHPLIVGGGAGVYNPEPLAPFFDAFFLGDGENAVTEIVHLAADRGKEDKNDTLEKLQQVPGMYIPSFWDVHYCDDGKISEVRPMPMAKTPKRVFIENLSLSPFPENIIVPFGSPAHDRLNVEIDRGCTQGCRFCQAGTSYRPNRERSPQEVLKIFDKTLKNTGYGDVSLLSLSAGDYSGIEQLLKGLMDCYADSQISVSLPSMRPATVTEPVIAQIKRVKKTGFTITAEAGTQRLRNVLNKKVTEEDVVLAARRLLRAGWRKLKLYFMIGLPTETSEDIQGIYDLAKKLDRLNEDGAKFNNINVSISNFVPKAHTAFQWTGQETMKNLWNKKEMLFELVKRSKRIRLKWHDAGMSHIEAVFSRGDRRLADVIEKAMENGQKLDSWTENFNFETWGKSFDETGLNTEWYANREFKEKDTLPWDHLDTGLTQKYFLKEWKMAKKGFISVDCKTDDCEGCGLDPKLCFSVYDTSVAKVGKPKPANVEGRYKYRLTYHIKESAKFLSHLEKMNLIFRACRIANLPVAHSEGFSPSPKVSFGPGLSVGMESYDEMLDIELFKYYEPWDVSNRLNSCLPLDIRFVDARQIRISDKSISSLIVGYSIRVQLKEAISPQEVERAVTNFVSKGSCPITNHKGIIIDIRQMVSQLEKVSNTNDILYTTSAGNGGYVKPDVLLKALFAEGADLYRRIVKTKSILSISDTGSKV
ncbi:MAG TPA: TIGR03960 family B12-binding radical SAM protein [Nitrospinota bacterium]|nr:TIGR03960 family B12-binding radical SAM protein [Nitrospinota bacterium]